MEKKKEQELIQTDSERLPEKKVQDENVIVKVFKAMLEYNFISYGTKKSF